MWLISNVFFGQRQKNKGCRRSSKTEVFKKTFCCLGLNRLSLKVVPFFLPPTPSPPKKKPSHPVTMFFLFLCLYLDRVIKLHFCKPEVLSPILSTWNVFNLLRIPKTENYMNTAFSQANSFSLFSRNIGRIPKNKKKIKKNHQTCRDSNCLPTQN